MDRILIRDALRSEKERESIHIFGWVRTRRDARGLSFLEINDGSCLATVQVVVDASIPEYVGISQISTGASVEVRGSLVASPGKGQKWEIRANSIELIGLVGGSYPLQKKRHTLEYLREIAHLRPRSKGH